MSQQNALRNAARWSLYGAVALMLACSGLLYLLLRENFQVRVTPWQDADFLEYREVRDLQELVQIDTTPETGREMDAAEWISDQLAAYGITAEIEDMGGGKANLWAKIDGQTDEFIVLHGHLDTDPIGDPSLWSRDPWSAEIEVVWLYARGSFDMKSTLIAQLHTMQEAQRRIDETGVRPKRGLLMLSTSSEETGSHEGAQHIVANRRDLLANAWVVFSEGGVVEATDIDKVKYLGVSFGQKRFVDAWYRAAELEPLLELQKQIREQPQPTELRVTEPVRAFLAEYGHTRILLDARIPLSDPDLAVSDPATWERMPPFYTGLFRDEVHTIDPVPAANGGYEMRVVVHLLEDADRETAVVRYLPPAYSLPEGVEVWIDPSVGATEASPLDHPAFTGLIEELRAELGDAPIGPYYLTYFANDGQFFRKLGIPTYGFQPFLGVPADSYRVGNIDERIALPTYIEGVERYRNVLLHLADR